MTTLSRPMRTMLESVLTAPTGAMLDDVERLRTTLTVVLRRCLDRPNASWRELVAAAAERGDWDHWRSGGLDAASDPGTDPAPEVTRDLLAELAEELHARGDVLGQVWEGPARQAAVESPHWTLGRQKRELIFAIESALAHVEAADARAVATSADTIVERDVVHAFPDLADALRHCAREIGARGGVGSSCRRRLVLALDGTPFAPAAATLPLAPPDRPSAGQVIRLLHLEPLPVEGGLFRQTWRRSDGDRVIGTATFAALTDDPDSFSAMHRLTADEIWHFYLGDPVQMVLLHPDDTVTKPVLGSDVVAGEMPQLVVAAGTWMGARLVPGGTYALFGNTMAPGFESSSYEGGVREQLQARWPSAARSIEQLTRPHEPTTMPAGL